MSNNQRILLVDALRGLAITGILLLHHIEHFDFYQKPDYDLKWLVNMDKWIWKNLFKLVAGKAFALFSLLFGVSFWIINENRNRRGEGYFYRHFWRMLGLVAMGILHLFYFRGDILIMYACLGMLVIFAKYLSNRSLLIISVFLLINPLYFYNLLASMLSWELYDFKLASPDAKIGEILSNGSYWEVLVMNFTSGYKSMLIWSWNAGRFFTILGLFYLGVLFGKRKLLESNDLKLWYKILVGSLILVYVFDLTSFVWLKQVSEKENMKLLRLMFDTYSKLSYMFLILSLIVIVWKHNDGNVWVKRFTDFGRMGLTNYILMSMIGSFLYYGWGLGLYQHCGSLYSLMIGVVCLWGQMKFSSWWLATHKQGPLEYLWRKMTWVKI